MAECSGAGGYEFGCKQVMCVCVYWSNQIPVACFTAKLQQSDNVGVTVNGGLL